MATTAFGRGARSATPNIKVATLSERAQARGTHAGRRGSRDPLYPFNSLLWIIPALILACS